MNINDLLARWREWWQAQDNKRKITFIIGGTVIIVTLALLVQVLLRPAYAPLFTQLDPAEAGPIIEELEAMQVPYRLTNGGQTIEVPEDQVYQARIKLASSGVLVGSDKGFELFDEQKFGITDFEQQVGYQRALQGELQRTIAQLNEVEQVRVHLVLPEKSLFAENETTPSAAIVLKLKTGTHLKPEQVQGIVDIVAGAVEGLQAQDVHIVDTKGNILNNNLPVQGEGMSTAFESTTRQQLKRNFEKELENRIQQMLSRIFGPGSAVVMVTAELNFDQKQTTSTTHGPGQVISRQQINEEGTGGSTGGTPGTDAELGYPTLEEQNQETFNREENITNYEVDVYQETLVKSPGEVERLSIAVVINESSLGDTGDEEAYTEKLNQIQRMIASASGYDSTRGDQINVSCMPFDSSLQSVFQEETAAEKQSLPEINPYVAAGICGGIIILLAVLLLLRRKRKRKNDELKETLEQESYLPPEPEPVIPPEPDIREQVRELAREKPGEVAEVLKLWLKE